MRDRTDALDDPQLRAFLPMLYVAWSDGALSDHDVSSLREQLSAAPWLRHAARAAVLAWLDPAEPPTANELAGLLAKIRAAAANVSLFYRASFVELGSALAGEPTEQELAALRALEAALGVREADAVRWLAVTRDAPAKAAPASFDVGALARVLDGPHEAIRARVRAFLAAPEHRHVYGVETGAYRETVLGWVRELADLGVGSLAYPGVVGDSADLGDFLAAFETLGCGDLSLLVKVGVQFGLFGGSIYSLGSDAQRSELLPRVARGELLGCFAMSEVGHGSNVMQLETTATYEPETDSIVVHTPSESARKDWAGNAAQHARLATVFAQLRVGGAEHGVHAVLVPIRDEAGALAPGVRAGDCGHKLGLNGVDNGRLWFDHVRVPRANLLSRFGSITHAGAYESPIASPSKRFFTMLGTLVGGRVSVASAAVSVSKVSLAIAVRYAVRRRQFGPEGRPELRLMDYRTHQRRLLPALAGTYALHFAAQRLQRDFVTKTDATARELEASAAGLKAVATWHATRTAQLCRECCGGQGYLSQNRLPALKSDSDVFATFEGDNVVLLQLVAKHLLGALSRSFNDDRVGTMLKQLSQAASAVIVEKNAFTARDESAISLRDAGRQLDAFEYRARSLVRSAAKRLRRRLGDRMPAETAMVEVQDHLLAAAEAHVEHAVLAAFVEAERAVTEPALAATLGKLRALYALSTLEQRAAFYLEDGYFEAPKARGVRKQVNALCAELAPEAEALVNAFAIPDGCLAAPIAFHDPAHPLL